MNTHYMQFLHHDIYLSAERYVALSKHQVQARNHGGAFRGRAPRWVFLVTYKIVIIFTASTAASDSMNCGERYMLRSDKANMFH